MKLIRRLWFRRRLYCLQAELYQLERERMTSAMRIERVLIAITATRWDLTAIDRPPITRAAGRARSDGKIRSAVTRGRQ